MVTSPILSTPTESLELLRPFQVPALLMASLAVLLAVANVLSLAAQSNYCKSSYFQLHSARSVDGTFLEVGSYSCMRQFSRWNTASEVGRCDGRQRRLDPLKLGVAVRRLRLPKVACW